MRLYPAAGKPKSPGRSEVPYVNGVMEILQATEGVQVKLGSRVPVTVIIAGGAHDGEGILGKAAEAVG